MAANIYPIQLGFTTIYLVKEDGVILIDGGEPNKLVKFRHSLEEASVTPEQVDLFILTHGHWDHVGSAREIKAYTGAKVLLHRRDLGFLEEAYPSLPQGLTVWGKFTIGLLGLVSPLIKISPFEVDIVMEEETFSLSDFGISGEIIHTPGHSWGSVSVLLDSGEAFVGDLAMNMLPLRWTPGLPIFGDDLQVIQQSWRTLFDMGVKTVYPAHGKPFPAEILRKAIET